MIVVQKNEIYNYINEDKILDDSYLVKKVIDYFNAKMLSHDWDVVHKNKVPTKEIVIDLYQCAVPNIILDKAIEIINKSGWNAKHDRWYSTRIAAPSHGIFLEID